MKNKFVLLTTFLVGAMPYTVFALDAKLCLQTVRSFSLNCKIGQQCCPNGKYTTSYTCPMGWTVNSLQKTCSRADVTGLSDDKGYYTQSYGMCDATSFQDECCDVSTGSSITCLSCVSEM